MQSGETSTVDAVEKVQLNEPIKVYNFEVEDYHTYYVSEQQVLVHNMCSEPVEITLSKSKYPETTKHIEEAIKTGKPQVLTINRNMAKTNRKESLKHIKKVQGADLDEYPPAMFTEGGKGASVKAISPSDNRGAGSRIGNLLRKFPDGTKVRIKIVE